MQIGVGALVALAVVAQAVLGGVGMFHHPGMQGRSLWPLLTGRVLREEHGEQVHCGSHSVIRWHRDALVLLHELEGVQLTAPEGEAV